MVTRAEVELAEGADAGDVANARRFVADFGHRFRYHAKARRWLAYADGVWAEDPDRVQARRAAEELARTLMLEAAAVESPELAKELSSHAAKTMTVRRLHAILDVAAPHLVVSTADLDADPWLLNVRNGVVDLRTSQLMAHDPALLLTRQASVSYLQDADAPTWRGFLATILPDAEVEGFMARLVGTALVGRQRDHVLPIAYGTGANGKSTFYGALTEVLGSYAAKIATTMLVGRGPDRSGPTPELLTLRGVRLAIADEPEAGARLRESHVKALTGGDRIVARGLYSDPVEFDPTHMLTLVTNHRPDVAGTDDGIWRRLILVPFDVQIPRERQDKDLPLRLSAEGSGILRWAVAGCLAAQRDGLVRPPVVQQATDAYRAEQDHLAAFIEDACRVGPDRRVLPSKLRDEYERWCHVNSIEPVTTTQLGRYLTDHGFRVTKSNGSRFRSGLDLKASL